MASISRIMNNLSDTIVSGACYAGLGALAGRGFSLANPATGAVFGLSSFLVNKATTPIFRAAFHRADSNESGKFIGRLFQSAVDCGAGAAISTAVGYPLSARTAALVTGGQWAIIGASALGALAFGGAVLVCVNIFCKDGLEQFS